MPPKKQDWNSSALSSEQTCPVTKTTWVFCRGSRVEKENHFPNLLFLGFQIDFPWCKFGNYTGVWSQKKLASFHLRKMLDLRKLLIYLIFWRHFQQLTLWKFIHEFPFRFQKDSPKGFWKKRRNPYFSTRKPTNGWQSKTHHE